MKIKIRDQGLLGSCYENGIESSGFIEGGEFLDQLSDC